MFTGAAFIPERWLGTAPLRHVWYVRKCSFYVGGNVKIFSEDARRSFYMQRRQALRQTARSWRSIGECVTITVRLHPPIPSTTKAYWRTATDILTLTPTTPGLTSRGSRSPSTSTPTAAPQDLHPVQSSSRHS